MHARVKRIVYGAHDPKTGVCGSSEDLTNANCLNIKLILLEVFQRENVANYCKHFLNHVDNLKDRYKITSFYLHLFLPYMYKIVQNKKHSKNK